MTSLQEASRCSSCRSAGETITVGIFSFYIAGSASEGPPRRHLIGVATAEPLVINCGWCPDGEHVRVALYRHPFSQSREVIFQDLARVLYQWALQMSSSHGADGGAIGLKCCRATSIGMTMVLATIMAGWRLLRRSVARDHPWLMLLGLVLGIVAGFVSMLRSVKAAERRMKDP
jgi:hypothetical protein